MGVFPELSKNGQKMFFWKTRDTKKQFKFSPIGVQVKEEVVFLM
jgi:hypothetical protein